MFIRSAVEEIRDGKGKLVREAQPALRVEFQSGGVIPDYAKQKALAHLDFPGIPENADPLKFVTWFHSQLAAEENGWDAEDLAEVERVLRERDGNGFIVVEQPLVEAPYANYVKHRKVQGRRTIEHAIADIVGVHDAAGFNVDQAVLFEQQNADKDSPAVIAALQGMLASEPSPDEEPEPLVAA